MEKQSSFRVASDIGGTFTDTVVIDEAGNVGRYKAPTVPDNPVEGVLATLQIAADERGISVAELLDRVAIFAHGTTVATNAMIENRRAQVGLLQTRGFGDTLSIMRGFKSLGLGEAEIKRFRTLVKQAPAVPKHLVREVSERVDYVGRVIMPLDEDDARRAVRELKEAGAEVFAVSLLWSFKNDESEKKLARIIEEEFPGTSVTLSSEFLPRIGEFERTLTTAINASLRPIVSRALTQFHREIADAGLKQEPLLMQSNGGLGTFEEVERRAAATAMSGPVGGVMASQYLGMRASERNIVTTDMGGTSFDVGLVLDGTPVMSNMTQIGRDRLALPSVAVRTVGAGSGSIAQVRNGILTVGPDSAGAVPGPACYGRGGDRPTVADADLVLGYLNADNFLGGRLALNMELARSAIDKYVAQPLQTSIEKAAEGIKTIVDARMADLIRQVTVEQGYDPTDFALFAYGGAGPMHSFSYGGELGTRRIVIPLTASVHSAFGIASSDLIVAEEVSHPMQSPPGSTDYPASIDPTVIQRVFDDLATVATGKLTSAGATPESLSIARSVEMRFRSQIHVLTVNVLEAQIGPDAIFALVDRFIDQYEARFGKGSALADTGIEITTFRIVATSAVPRSELGMLVKHDDGTRIEPRGTRRVFAGGQYREAKIFDADDLYVGAEIDGLAIVETRDTTIVIGAGQSAVVDEVGSVIIEHKVLGATAFGRLQDERSE